MEVEMIHCEEASFVGARFGAASGDPSTGWAGAPAL